MSMAPQDKADLLRFTSYSRRNSNAYLDTISNSALIAFLQFEQTMGKIRSQPKTVLAIDVFLDFLVGIAISSAGGLLVKNLVGNLVSRVVNSRMMVGKFMNTIPAGTVPRTVKLYAGVSKRFNFGKYQEFLKAHRIESANIDRIQYGANLVYSGLVAPKLKKGVTKGTGSRGAGNIGISSTVSIVDSAMAYSVNQKVLNDIMFDELENAIRLDLAPDQNVYNAVQQELLELHLPLYHNRKPVSLDKAREQLILYFELCLWGISFYQKYGAKNIPLQSVTNDKARLVLFGDSGKDHTLTKYLINRFNPEGEKYNDRVYSRADHLRPKLKTAGAKANAKKKDFGDFKLE